MRFLLLGLLLLATPHPSRGEVLDFDSVLARAVSQSHALEIAALDKEISLNRLEEARSLSYPTLSMRFDSEYIHSFQDGQDVVSIGEAVSTGEDSRFQHSVNLNARYLLYSFGAKGLQLENAEQQVRVAELRRVQTDLELRLSVLGSYSRCLKLSKRRDWAAQVLLRRKTIYRLQKRLQQAGLAGNHQVAETALLLSDALSSLDNLSIEFQTALQELAIYLRRDLDSRAVKLNDFKPFERSTDFQVSLHPEIQTLDAQIEAKDAEYRLVGRNFLPTFNILGALRLFGSDRDSFSGSYRDIEEREAAVALVVQWEIFSGFKDLAIQKRILHERKRLELEREKRVMELASQVDTLRSNLASYESQSSHRQEQALALHSFRRINERLSEEQIVDGVTFLEKEIELLDKELEHDLAQVDRSSTLMHLQILTREKTS